LEEIELDGSYGEGGGQLLRTAAYFSVALHRSIHVTNIRKGRGTPGLRPQHVAVLRILRDTSKGILEGDDVGSTEIRFTPGSLGDASTEVDLGTAASIALILQALVPAVSISGSSLRATFRGGTDVPWSPTSDYVTRIIQPAFRLLGINFELTLRRRGYYPVGGGIAELVIHPCREVIAIDLPERNVDSSALILSRCAMLPRHVAERQRSAALHLLTQKGVSVEESLIGVEESSSPGSSILIALLNDHCMIGADALGRRGARAESVGEEAARRFLTSFDSRASVDPNLADNIAPLLCLSKSSSRFFVPEVTDHLRTSLHVARVFTGVDYDFSKASSSWLVTITPNQQNS